MVITSHLRTRIVASIVGSALAALLFAGVVPVAADDEPAAVPGGTIVDTRTTVIVADNETNENADYDATDTPASVYAAQHLITPLHFPAQP